jgi:hypothetical protein
MGGQEIIFIKDLEEGTAKALIDTPETFNKLNIVYNEEPLDTEDFKGLSDFKQGRLVGLLEADGIFVDRRTLLGVDDKGASFFE